MRTDALPSVCTYDVDASGRISFVDEDWRAFAIANQALEYASVATLYGRPLLSFISEPTTRHIYALLMARVVDEQVTIRVPFRCDAPAMRRWYEMEMSPRPAGGVRFTSRVVRTEPRETLLHFDRAPAGALVRMCSWCKTIDAGGGRWLKLELAVVQLGLFATADVPAVTHGICPPCVRLFEFGGGFSVDPA